MSRLASTWHSIGALCGCLALTGCYDAHGRGGPPVPGLDGGPTDAYVPGFRDVWSLDDAGRGDAGERCAELFAMLRAGVAPEEIGCDGRTFPRDCVEPVNECCRLHLACAIDPGDGGHVETVLDCDDWCEQGCSTYDAEDCVLVPGCEWFDPRACGPAPGLIEGPACIDERGAPCSSDVECPEGQLCRAYWINPCAGLPCDACGGEERRCSY